MIAQGHPDTKRPMDDYQIARQRAFGSSVPAGSVGIEIGAGFRPTFPKAAGYAVTVVDHCDTATLRDKYDRDPNVPRELVAQIEPVDVVWSGGSYRDAAGMPRDVDFVVACHVIEHATDLVGFLADCAGLLAPGGRLLLAIPDRRCVLDCCRPASTLGDVLLAHVAPDAYDLKSHLDEVWSGSLLDRAGAWSMEHLMAAANAGRKPLPQHPAAVAGGLWRRCVAAGHVPHNGGYRDAHRWVFDADSFEEIVSFLEVHGGVPLALESLPPTYGCEFYAILRRQDAPHAEAAGLLDRIRTRAMQSRAWVP